MENLAEYYYNALTDTKNPGLVLNQMYNNLFDTETNVNRIKTFNRLIKLYGRTEVYFALLNIANWGISSGKFDETRDPFALISKFVINRLEAKYDTRNSALNVDLDSYLKKIEKTIKTVKKDRLDIPETFLDGDDE